MNQLEKKIFYDEKLLALLLKDDPEFREKYKQHEDKMLRLSREIDSLRRELQENADETLQLMRGARARAQKA